MNPEQKDLLAAIGVALLLTQTVERVMRLCMMFVLPQSSALTLEALERQEKTERKKTLGYFLVELRKRADLDPRFDALLDEFLANRNLLVHNFGDVPGGSLNTESGLAAANAFVREFIGVTEAVLKVFVGLVAAWQDQAGLHVPEGEGHPFFAEIDAVYKPLVDEIFFRKSDQA